MPDLCKRDIRISIHALLAESDCFLSVMSFAQTRFLSTLSLRRATWCPQACTPDGRDFYPRSPCGERQEVSGDTWQRGSNFYPRSPCGERRAARLTPTASRNFYPRSPCGERRRCFNALRNRSGFLSTLSLRRATPRLDAEY